MKITILGCGPSGGVPRIGNDWGACDPAEPRNRRRRASILVQQDDTTILVDTSPDMRMQLLDAGIGWLDAIIWTHAHGDHLNGIDDVRSVNRAMDRPIDAYATPETLDLIEKRFGHVFQPVVPGKGYYKPTLIRHEVREKFHIGNIEIDPIVQDHGFGTTTLGLRFGRAAYSTDVVNLSEAALDQLSDLDLWIVDCLGDTPHPTHAHLDQVLAWRERVKPRQMILTHMDIGLDYQTLRQKLPAGMVPAYDGLALEV
jgi:phosphoribosyl 1,2-cyclic phosphate phosphodiesterase